MTLRHIKSLQLFIIAISLALCSCNYRKDLSNPPYSLSPVIAGINWDFDNVFRAAPGSDLWPVTWACDNNLYTSWGDGGGFGGTNKDGRASLGFARIEGMPPVINCVNIWGGNNGAQTANFGGKCSGIISVDGTIYATINLQNKRKPDQQIAWSNDLGKSWTKASWLFDGDGPFLPKSFINFGKDNDGSRDHYIYIYGSDRAETKSLYLARVPKNKIKSRSEYEFFQKLDNNKQPVWTSDIYKRGPVARDTDGIGATAAIYHSQIKKYVLTTHHGDFVGRFGIFDAHEPWGPWTTVAYYNDWGGLGEIKGGMPHTFPIKWISDDGKILWMVFSGMGVYDSFNLIKAELVLK